MKNRFLTILGAGIISLMMATSVAMPAMAACDNHKTVAGLRTWYYGLDLDADCSPTGSIEDVIGKIILNIIFDLVGFASVAAVGYIIYAGYQIVLSNGDAAKYAKGKKTLSGAIIGLVICLLALAVVAFVSDTLLIS